MLNFVNETIAVMQVITCKRTIAMAIGALTVNHLSEVTLSDRLFP